MARELSGKRAILTGASGGIGRATAEALVRAGVRVALAARTADALNQLADELRKAGGDVIAVPTDVTQPADRERLVATAVEKFGGLDILVEVEAVVVGIRVLLGAGGDLGKVLEVALGLVDLLDVAGVEVDGHLSGDGAGLVDGLLQGFHCTPELVARLATEVAPAGGNLEVAESGSVDVRSLEASTDDDGDAWTPLPVEGGRSVIAQGGGLQEVDAPAPLPERVEIPALFGTITTSSPSFSTTCGVSRREFPPPRYSRSHR